MSTARWLRRRTEDWKRYAEDLGGDGDGPARVQLLHGDCRTA
jgi:hypothetical protein